MKVDPHGLAEVGRRTQEVAAAMPAETARIQGPSEDAATGLRGWRTEAALARWTRAWEDCLHALAAEVGANGANMVSTAGNYSDAEVSVYSSLYYSTGRGH